MSSTYLISFLVSKKDLQASGFVFLQGGLVLFSNEIVNRLNFRPQTFPISGLKIKGQLASFRAKDDVVSQIIAFVQSDAANDDFSRVKFHRSRY